MNKYKQQHPETCLAKSILIAVDKGKKATIKKKDELDIFIFALKFNRENFVVGHLEKAVKRFNVKIDWLVDGNIYYNFVKKLRFSKKITLRQKKIDLKLLDQSLKNAVILPVDRFYLWKKEQGAYYKYHWPHFIVVLKKEKDNYLIIDPDDGKEKLISKKILSKAISSLKNKLWFSPHIIVLK